MNDFKISASIIAANPLKLSEEISCVYNAGADWLHFDVMDNHYVPNLTYGPMVCKAIKNEFKDLPIDVHLMVSPTDELIYTFAKAGAHTITIHPEGTKHLDRSLTLIQKLGCKAGLAFNPGTPLNYLNYLIEKIDMVLIMSVNPGFGGQTFIPSAVQKLKDARKYLERICTQKKKKIRLEIDGGINIHNIATVAAAGADTFVSGSAIFCHQDRQSVISSMREELAKSVLPTFKTLEFSP